ncbi:protein mono-ADP-ribosyltransferase PARP14-like [Dendroctonus ponderosae]|uniref:protein mono-ADP-ribosyltransferase PARP14 n=1 Tax=Dendroctonus ponderosae TaxID=77166 RepID=UPI002034C60D|nr:protein mono-ADP-ribosyltransferase PARP14 [Dendroctonus ponderosae]XP_048519327.1 protein mono-ADP-ribosyltransferase PARP14-like [Dendroctonus ponderosae]KAH0998712.1 hypothetical protein HUJ05_003252 [Dendroctonus ponderosae]KAH0999589.1 hypothetical protein HUJ05_009470 [Dendroctonus ponderosae]
MFYSEVLKNVPSNWSPMTTDDRYMKKPLMPYTEEFAKVIELLCKRQYYGRQFGIFRIQNPLLWSKFLLRKSEYDQRGPVEIKTLYHDTSIANAESIIEFNFDWRMGQRTKYGQGVYFSVEASAAFRHSTKDGSRLRAMFVVDVLVQNVQEGQPNMCLPAIGFDTILANNNNTYVKFFDSEYYPKYFMVYEPNPFFF